MAKFDIKKLIETHTTDGEVDYTKVNEALEEQNRNIVVKEASKEVEKLKGEQLTNILKEVGVEGESIDDLKLYIKKMGGSTDEVKEAMLKLEKEYKELETKYSSEVEAFTALKTANQEKERIGLIKGLGVEDEEQVNYLKWKFENQVTDDKDFAMVVEDYKKENKITTTTKFIKDPFSGAGSGIEMDISGLGNRNKRRTKK
jgi:hypothetical protein